MDWTALHTHFVDATSAEPFPFGPDAVELDYSRLSRALGEKNGLQDQPWSGLAFLSVPDAEVDGAARQYSGWAAEAGWRFLRLSARPTVAAPEPVAYGLGAAISGEDSLIFAGARDMGRPARGKRPRSKACSMPLSPGERWAIAVDRVRRRTRQEIAREGLLLFVESAEMLTPAALNHLLYYANAHRAWRANMLCEPARCYIALAAAPGKARLLREFLDRCGVSPGLKAEIATGRRADRPMYGIEEEHILAAVADAPHALAEADLAALFGSTGRDACRRLQEVGLLTTRSECGVRCILPTPAALDLELPLPPARVREAVLERYRLHDRKGREHVLFGSALLQFRLGRRGRAMGHLGAAGPSDPAFVPIVHFEEIDRELKGMDGHLRACDLALAYALSAHQRSYAEARLRAEAIGARSVRRPGELARVIMRVLCVGRGHMDASLPEGFWATIRSESIDPALLDATCILSELFARLRGMSEQEIKDRYDIARESLTRATVPPPPPNGRSSRCSPVLLDVAKALWRKVSCVEAYRVSEDVERINALWAGTFAHIVHGSTAPGFIIGSMLYTEVQTRLSVSDATPADAECLLATRLTRTTSHLTDLTIMLSFQLRRFTGRGLRTIVRGLVDDIVLSLPFHSRSKLRVTTLLALTSIADQGTWRTIVNDILPRDCGQQGEGIPGRITASAGLARASMLMGDYVCSTVILDRMGDDRLQARHQALWVLALRMLCSRRLMRWDRSDSEIESLSTRRHVLSATYTAVLRHIGESNCAHARRDFAASRTALHSAATLLGHPAPSEKRSLRLLLLQEALKVSALERMANPADPYRAGEWKRLCVKLIDLGRNATVPIPALNLHDAVDAMVLGLEDMARRGLAGYEALVAMLALETLLGKSLRAASGGIVETCSRCAPTLLAAVGAELSNWIHMPECVGSDEGALTAALGIVGEKLRNIVQGELSWIAAKCTRWYDHAVAPAAAMAVRRQCRQAAGTWPYDGAVARVAREWGGELRATGREEVRQLACVTRDAVSGKTIGRRVVLRQEAGRGSRRWVSVHDASSDTAVLDVHKCGSGPASGHGRWRGCRGSPDSRGDEHSRISGTSDAASELRTRVAAASACDYPVIIVGETGVGKELVARELHRLSRRRSRPFVVMSCAALPDALVESELFGHVRGAFTGASEGYGGHIAAAGDGVLFLDDVASMPARLQVALLRVVECGEYRHLGAAATSMATCRIISAADSVIDRLVSAGAFRRDLYYRTAVLRIDVPPLRDRGDDAVQLAKEYCQRRGYRMEESAADPIRRYAWPGNIRELFSVMDRAALLAADGAIGSAAIDRAIQVTDPRIDGLLAGSGRDGATGHEVWEMVGTQLAGEGPFDARRFAEVAAVSRRTAQRHLSLLVSLGKILRVGAGPRTRYLPTDMRARQPVV